MIILKLTIILCILSLMVVGGVYTYRYLNNKLTSTNSAAGMICYSLALFLAIAGIYSGGLVIITKLYGYLTG